MTAIRWILWLAIGGAAVWVFQRFFAGSGLPEGIVTPTTLADAGLQVGTRGTGVARGAREASWRTTLGSSAGDPSAVDSWFNSWSRSTPGGLPGTAGNGESMTTLETFITLGDPCSPPGSTALGELTYLFGGGTSQVIARCKGGYGVYAWEQVGVINKDS